MASFLFCGAAHAQVSHHNVEVQSCRAIPNGALQILGKSDTNNLNYSLTYSVSGFSETIIDRYFSLCMAALATEKKLRLDYLVCSGQSCTPQGISSIQLIK